MTNSETTGFPRFLIAVFLCFFLSAGYGQTVSANPEQSKILIGDQIKLQLRLSDVDPEKFFISRWFHFEDSSNHINLVQSLPLDSLELNGRISFFQTVVITSFDSGTWMLPTLSVILTQKNNGRSVTVVAPADSLTVLPVDVSGMKGFHDMKPIIEVEKQTNYWMFVFAAITLAIIFFLFRYILRRKKPDGKPPAIVYQPRDVLQHALQQIHDLPLPVSGNLREAKLFYSAISEIEKEYFQKRFDIASGQATTDELIMLTGVYLQKEPFRSRFYQLLRLQDAVKFANYLPPADIGQDIKQTLSETLKHVHQFNQQQPDNDA